jgi:hypothetical protein
MERAKKAQAQIEQITTELAQERGQVSQGTLKVIPLWIVSNFLMILPGPET